MRIAMFIRSSARSNIGGDVIQYRKTAEGLRSLGCDISLFFADEQVSYWNYDVLHFFNLIRPSDILRHLKRTGRPAVVSSIFVEYRPEDFGTGIQSRIFRAIGAHNMEYIKTLTRFVLKRDALVSPDFLWLGQKRSIHRVLSRVRAVLPNSLSEGARLTAAFPKITRPIRPVVNGVDVDRFLSAEPDDFYRDYVMCVGRIEPLKNQLGFVRALTDLGLPAVVVGNPSGIGTYYDMCRREAGSNITFVPFLEQQSIARMLKAAKVHVLPSYFETTGLVSLEAGLCGCNIVVTSTGDQVEYFSSIAEFCDPDDVESIVLAVSRSFNAPRNRFGQSEIIRQRYSWNVAAQQTLAVYREVVDES